MARIMLAVAHDKNFDPDNPGRGCRHSGPHECSKSVGGLHYPTGNYNYHRIRVAVNFPRRKGSVRVLPTIPGLEPEEIAPHKYEDLALGGAFAHHDVRPV